MSDHWWLSYDDFDPAHERHRETLLTIGNGYAATRGAMAHRPPCTTSYPGTYLAGIYNRLSTSVGRTELQHESLVNMPDWTRLELRLGGGDWLRHDQSIVRVQRRLDMHSGTLRTELVLQDVDGRRTHVVERRFIHLLSPHIGVIEQTITPENWSGDLYVRASIDANVRNANVLEDTLLSNHHLRTIKTSGGMLDALVEVETITSRVRAAVAQRVIAPEGTLSTPELTPSSAAHVLRIAASSGVPIEVGKIVAMYHSRDGAIHDPASAAQRAVQDAPDSRTLRETHERGWHRVWERYAMHTGTEYDQLLRLHWYHIIVALGPNVADRDVGVPARGLHGEGYRGHVFWDELFVLPLLTTRYPETCRALLMYRYRRLPAARALARSDGRAGAKFPWQSGSDGGELTPTQLFNHHSGRWMEDHSQRQYHVGLAVAWNVWQYVQATDDNRFLVSHGAELMIEIARYFASLARLDAGSGRYHLEGVMGPDEFHDGYPEAPGGGVRDNAYTNIMVCWLLCRVLELPTRLTDAEMAEVADRTGPLDEDLERFARVACAIHVPFHDGMISQFDGFEQLDELDWAAYRDRYDNIGRLDLILEAEGDTVRRYKASKQADVLMLFYLFSAEEITQTLDHLGYAFDPASIPRSVGYYLSRCSHGSTLSRVVHAWVLARSDRVSSWSLLGESLVADLRDTQGGTTAEGIHLGAMAASLDLLQRCYSGMELRDDTLRFSPTLPPELPTISFALQVRGHSLLIHVTSEVLTVASAPGKAPPLRVAVRNDRREVAAGEQVVFPLSAEAATIECV